MNCSPSQPVGTIHLRVHGAKYIEATRPCVKMQLKDQSEVYGGNDYTVDTSFLFDDPTGDLVITVYDRYSVSMRSDKTARSADDGNGAIVGHIVIPLVSFFTVKGIVKPAQQWYELVPVSQSLQAFGQYRATDPVTRPRLAPLGFLCVSVGIHLNRSIPNVFALYFQGGEHLDPRAPNLWVEPGADRGSKLSIREGSDAPGTIPKPGLEGGSGDKAGFNLLYSGGPVELLLENSARVHGFFNVLPFDLADVGPGPILVLVLIFAYACASIRAWEAPLYLFLFVGIAGGASTLLSPRKKVKLWSEYSREAAATAAVALSNGGSAYRCEPRIETTEQSAYIQVGAASRRDVLRRDFIRLVERADLLVGNVEKFLHLWTFVDARVSVVAYSILLALCVLSSFTIARFGVSGLLFFSGSFAFVGCYMLINADLTGRIDDLCEETEEQIRQALSGDGVPNDGAAVEEVKRVKLKEKIIQAWKLMRRAHHCLMVFWSRVPTRFELEHRQMAGMCCVVDDGREMMDAAAFAGDTIPAAPSDSADQKNSTAGSHLHVE